MSKTKIEWTDAVWNPVTGCSKISDGCKNCYAERLTARFRKDHKPWTLENAQHNIKLHSDRLDIPFRWRQSRRVFVNSMSDLFHVLVPDVFIDDVFWTMAQTSEHRYQVLTKRPERMLESIKRVMTWGNCSIDHVWLGVSVENQKAADERIPILLQTPAKVRFLSCEPLLGPLDLTLFGPCGSGSGLCTDNSCRTTIDWVICGGESGPGARPMEIEWARSLMNQCTYAGVPFFMKQGSQANWPDFKNYDSFPADLRVREFPGGIKWKSQKN